MSDGYDIYDRFCGPAMDGMKRGIEENNKAIGELKTIVTNGLTHRVKSIEKIVWVIISGVVTTLGAIIVQIILNHTGG